MFRKQPLSLGASTPIRSSDRRKLINSLSTQYPSLTPEELKLLVPDGIRCGNVRTSGQIDGVIYSDPKDRRPLWVGMSPGSAGRKEGGQNMLWWPTVYTVAAHLGMEPAPAKPIIPFLPIHQPPPQQWLTGGAPLFVPAVKFLSQPHRLPALSACSSAPSPSESTERYLNPFIIFVTPLPSPPSVPPKTSSSPSQSERYQILGIGQFTSAHESFSAHLSAWYQSKEVVEKDRHSLGDTDVGRLCDTLNMVGDTLWEMGTKMDLPSIPYLDPEFPLAPPPSKAGSSAPQEQPKAPSTENSSPPSLDGLAISSPAAPVARSSAPLTTAEIDRFLTLALLQSLPSIPPTSLPIQSSTLYSAHVLPNRPGSISREQMEEVVIGKSSWKKVGKWMKILGDGKGGEGLLRLKEAKDGSHTILGINQSHDQLQNHVPHRTIVQELARQAKQAETPNVSTLAGTSGIGATTTTLSSGSAGACAKEKCRDISIEEFWRPANLGAAFWEVLGHDKDAYLTHQEVLDGFNRYVTDQNLTNMKDRAAVLLDEQLGKACGAFKKGGAGIEDQVSMRRDRVLEGLKGEMSAVVRVGGEGGSLRKGALQPIHVATKPRGKKTVTILHGLETFGIDPVDLAEELRRVCAGSASVDPLTGAPPAANKKEVMVQGSQVKAVTDVLVARGVPRKWIKEDAGAKRK